MRQRIQRDTIKEALEAQETGNDNQSQMVSSSRRGKQNLREALLGTAEPANQNSFSQDFKGLIQNVNNIYQNVKYRNQNDDDDIEEEQDGSSPEKAKAEAEPNVFSESVKALNSDRGFQRKETASNRQNKVNVFKYNAPAQSATLASSQQFQRGFAEPAEAWDKSENSNMLQKSVTNP